MTEMNSVDYKLFCTIAKMNQNTLLKSMKNFLSKYYPREKINATPKYILCEGTSPIMLVAHLDTVFKVPPDKIYYDRQQHVMWSPQGLGADDRAGVFAIMKIIQNGYRPHVCFTTDEEVGGIGAQTLVNRHKTAPFDIKYIVQLDRQGVCDCVFYSCENFDFQSFIEKYGFLTEWGTFSDISTICPTWKIAGVNLSVGYFNEHNKIETLHTDALYSTIKKVKQMIIDIEKAPTFEYIALPYDEYLTKLYNYYSFPTDDEGAYYFNNYYKVYSCQCSNCNKHFPAEDVILVKSKDKTNISKYYCLDCIGAAEINWCEECGEPFEANDKDEKYCLEHRK